MNKHLETIFAAVRSILLATFTTSLIFGPSSALAVQNIATWDIAGVAQAQATFDLVSFNAGAITLNKTAFVAGAATTTELLDNATVPATTAVDFMIFVNNQNGSAVNNINIADALPAGFTYVPAFIKVNTANTCAALVCTPAERAVLYENAALVVNQNVEPTDVAGFAAGTISAGLGAGNAQLDVGAGAAFALVFRATVD
ncbi:MAG: hypothetical protein IBX47_11950 [Desulfuromonadales bacterium]|nr:hypothetical protein [Desulfuromonadales bacterium]